MVGRGGWTETVEAAGEVVVLFLRVDSVVVDRRLVVVVGDVSRAVVGAEVWIRGVGAGREDVDV